ncbi:hypothetical protein OG562_27645 [Streptomyces sp. NBC_01275]|uniref:hypothetical protein n=1 Tax=Streptomyces sp. NBC_01275 TaxID=2903807 RepID=UPI00224F17C7|nr:hypothetical protein [Streptomyces sp. NBC_01275]MCX4764673.1 hypothetical protein [Streptomyces sp. NBC_01275]
MPVGQHGDPFEDRLSAALHQVGGAFDSPRAELVAGGAARGRRLRLRRRTAVVGSAAGLALVGVGGALLGPWGSSAPRPSSVANGTAKPSASASTSAAFSAEEVIRTLEKLLPKGRFSSVQGRGTGEKLPPLALVVFDDGEGAAAISVGLDRIPASSDPGGKGGVDPAREVMPCPDSATTSDETCVTETLADGSAVTLYQGYEYPDRRVATKAWGADLVTPDGYHVSVAEWNSPAEKGKPVTRPEPPLTTAQLKTLATAGEWRRIADAIPGIEEPAAPTTSSTGPAPMTGTIILRKLSLLLPKGLDRVSHGSDETEFGYFVVDDGKGESLVQVNVQRNMSDVADELFGADAETLADGTRVATRQAPGEKGGAGVVMWTVDTLRTDGTRVVVSAFNSGDQEQAATRAKPALTMDQLRAIAISPRWQSSED